MGNEFIFNNFKQWYKDGVATDEDLDILLKNKALTSDQIDEIKSNKDS